MTAKELVQVIYAELVRQEVTFYVSFDGEPLSAEGFDGRLNLVALANAILKAQNDESAMSRTSDPVDAASFDRAVEESSLV